MFVFEKIKVVVYYDKQNKLQIMRTFIIEYLIMLAFKIDKKEAKHIRLTNMRSSNDLVAIVDEHTNTSVIEIEGARRQLERKFD